MKREPSVTNTVASPTETINHICRLISSRPKDLWISTFTSPCQFLVASGDRTSTFAHPCEFFKFISAAGGVTYNIQRLQSVFKHL